MKQHKSIGYAFATIAGITFVSGLAILLVEKA